MSKTTVIPAGYRITVESWENDADNYRTKIMEGLQESSVKFLIDFCKIFYSQNNYYGPKGYGNMYDPDEEELAGFKEAYSEVIGKHITQGTESKILQYFFDEVENRLYEDQSDGVNDLAFDLGLRGGDYYTRVFESVKVEYVPTEIILEDVTDIFV